MEAQNYSHILYNLRVDHESYALRPGTIPLPNLGISLTISDSKQDILLEKIDPKTEIQYQNCPVSDLLSLESGGIFEINGCPYVVVPKAGVFFNSEQLGENQRFSLNELKKRGLLFDGNGHSNTQRALLETLASMNRQRLIVYGVAIAFAIFGITLALNKKEGSSSLDAGPSPGISQGTAAAIEGNPAPEDPSPMPGANLESSKQDDHQGIDPISVPPTPAASEAATTVPTPKPVAPSSENSAKQSDKAPSVAQNVLNPALSPEQIKQYKNQLQEIKLEAGFDPDSARERLKEMIENLPKNSPLHQQAAQLLKTI